MRGGEVGGAAVAAGAELAAKGDFVVFGVKPDRAEAAYGYIRGNGGGTGEVEAFVEKPDAKRAKEFVASGKYTWNSGMFMLRVSCWQKALACVISDRPARTARSAPRAAGCAG